MTATIPSNEKTESYAKAKTRTMVSNYIFNFFNFIILSFVLFVTLYPFWNTIAISFNDGIDSIRGGIKFFPRIFTWQNYKAVFTGGAIFQAAKISVIRTVLQTVLSVFFTCMLAYALSRKEFVLKKPCTIILVISMYVSAGLIPSYFLVKGLGMLNNFSVYIIPNLVDVFSFILVRTYINGLPDSFIESARIDGAGEFKIFMKIIMPLIVPAIAIIALFAAVGAWNSWFDTYLYASGKVNLHSLQYKLMEFLQSSQNQSHSAADAGAMALAGASGTGNQVTPISIRAAITIVATVPILVAYPFAQRYFLVGMTIGGVKE
jgi:putative aldouronate transport system permease protein